MRDRLRGVGYDALRRVLPIDVLPRRGSDSSSRDGEPSCPSSARSMIFRSPCSFPASSRRPIVMYDPQGALRLAVVEQDCASALDASWDSAGVYVLLWPTVNRADPKPNVYVGQAAQGLRKRIGQHVAGKPGWHRAVLVDRGECQIRLQLGPGRLARGSALGPGFESRARATDEQGAAKGRHPARLRSSGPRDGDRRDPARYAAAWLFARSARHRSEGYEEGPLHGHRRGPDRGGHVDPLGDVLVFIDPVLQATATVKSDGRLEVSGVSDDFPSTAATVTGRPTNGWADSALVRPEGTITLMKLREELTEPAPTGRLSRVRRECPRGGPPRAAVERINRRRPRPMSTRRGNRVDFSGHRASDVETTSRSGDPPMPPRSLPALQSGTPTAWDEAIYGFLVEKGSRSGLDPDRRELRPDALAVLPGDHSGSGPARRRPGLCAWHWRLGTRPPSTTVGARIACLRSFYRFMIRMGLVAATPATRLSVLGPSPPLPGAIPQTRSADSSQSCRTPFAVGAIGRSCSSS